MYRSINFKRFFAWGLTGPIVALNLWILAQVFKYFEHLITIVILAAMLAFLLNYAVRFLERLMSRTQAVIAVLMITLALLGISAVTLVPILIDQASQLLTKIPAWLEASRRNIELMDGWAKLHRLPLDLREFSSRFNSRLEGLQDFASQAIGVAWGTVSGLFDTVLVIVLAFYMLLYGDRLWQGLMKLLPPHISTPFSSSLRLNFQSFFISQFLLGIFMFGALVPIFLVLRIPFALLFALLIGVSELIPFIGAPLGIGLVTVLVMLQDFKLALLGTGAAIFMQQIKDNLLAPKLMGQFTGLNPIWVVISVLMGAQIAGVLGVIVAVPIAGTIKGTAEALNVHRTTINNAALERIPKDR